MKLSKIALGAILIALTATNLSARHCSICICTETNSKSKAQSYIKKMEDTIKDIIHPQLDDAIENLTKYNEKLKDNVLIQREWTSALAAEVMDKKERLRAAEQERSITCELADAQILVIQQKIEQVETAISRLKSRNNKIISDSLEKASKESNLL